MAHLTSRVIEVALHAQITGKQAVHRGLKSETLRSQRLALNKYHVGAP